MWLLKARDFSFVSVFVSSNWYFYKPLFVISWVSRRQKSIECCRASEWASERERERDVSFVDLLTIKSISQLTGSLEKQWVISKLYASMTDDEPDPCWSLFSCILPLHRFCAATCYWQWIQTRHIWRWLASIKLLNAKLMFIGWTNFFWPIRTSCTFQPWKWLKICKCQQTITPPTLKDWVCR